jgi:hypothetical protein
MLLLLTACGESTAVGSAPTPPPAQKRVDVCALVTGAEMGQVLGGTYSATLKDGRAAGEIYCLYKNTSDSTAPESNITVLTQDGETTWNTMVAGHTNDPEHYIQIDVDGTNAIFEKNFSRLWLMKKDYTLIIRVPIISADGSGNNSDKELDVTKQLAQIALSRL